MIDLEAAGVIIALLGLFITVIKPLLTLNSSIVRLTDQMEHVSEDLNDLTDQNLKSHQRMHERIDSHDDTLGKHTKQLIEHEQRLDRIDEYHKLKDKQEALQHDQKRV